MKLTAIPVPHGVPGGGGLRFVNEAGLTRLSMPVLGDIDRSVCAAFTARLAMVINSAGPLDVDLSALVGDPHA